MASERVTVGIRGMTCAACVAHTEQVMREQDGVIWAAVNFAAQEVLIVYDPTACNASKLVDAVRDLGYELNLGAERLKSSKYRLPSRRPL